jgi:HD-GYP domain-containing protein (c-di-GMP phosphodiesterase class II)
MVAVSMALQHHEKMTGKGYPFGRSNSSEKNGSGGINLHGRMAAIIDSFSAMVGYRTHQDAIPVLDAIQKIRDNAGLDFCPDLTTLFIREVLGVFNQYRMGYKKGKVEVAEKKPEAEKNDQPVVMTPVFRVMDKKK